MATLPEPRYLARAGGPPVLAYLPLPASRPKNVAAAAAPTAPPDFSRFDLSMVAMQVNIASQLNVSPMFSANATSDERALLLDAVALTSAYSERETSSASRAAVRQGVGLRIALRVAKVDANTALNLPMLAARAELTHSSTQFHVISIGLPIEFFETIVKNTPTMGSLNVDTFSKLERLLNEGLPAYLDAHRAELVPVEFTAGPVAALRPGPTIEAASVSYALARISQGFTLPSALRSSGTGFDFDVIRTVYARFAGMTDDRDEKRKPDGDIRDSAKVWLSIGD